MLVFVAVSDKEENLDKKQLELLYRNERYVLVCVSKFSIAVIADS